MRYVQVNDLEDYQLHPNLEGYLLGDELELNGSAELDASSDAGGQGNIDGTSDREEKSEKAVALETSSDSLSNG